MPLNNSYDEQAVIQAIASALETFYGTLIEKIDGLNIQKVMKRKNPYLYRAKAMQSATEIVDSVLTAFVSSSEETIFGNCFFEPIAIAASGGNKALAEGIDIMIQNNETNTISAIAVKSGPSVFNADSKKRQEQNFTAASKLAQQAKARYEAYMSDWCLMSADNRRVQRKAILPIGTCVEGIRVEFSTPGYKNTSILAIANIKNSKYQTNVARSAIELDANNEILSDIYDVYNC